MKFTKLVATKLGTALASGLFGFYLTAQEPAKSPASPFADVAKEASAAALAAVPGAALLGNTRLVVWGFDIYDAWLWAGKGFTAANYKTQPLALELQYLRDFKALEIAKRSIAEMRRSATISDEQAEQWVVAMTKAWPDIKKGDSLTGIYKPGVGVQFLFNGKPRGEVADAEFAALFMGIWLSPKSSEPKMRQALLGKAAS